MATSVWRNATIYGRAKLSRGTMGPTGLGGQSCAAVFCYFVVSSFFHTFNPLTLDKGEKGIAGVGKEVTLLLDYFLLIRAVEFFGANLILAVSTSNFFLLLFLCT